jgi:hypothetical protein
MRWTHASGVLGTGFSGWSYIGLAAWGAAGDPASAANAGREKHVTASAREMFRIFVMLKSSSSEQKKYHNLLMLQDGPTFVTAFQGRE